MMTSGYFRAQHEGRMRLPPLIGASLIGVGGSLLGHLFGGGNKTSQNQSSTQNSTTNASSTPTFDPRFAGLLNALIGRSQSQLSTGSALPQGFATNAVEGINDAFKGAGANLTNSLTARGLASSPVAAPVLGGLEMGRAAEIGDLGVKLPMLEREAQNQQFAQLMGLLGLGRGQNTTSTTQGTSTGTGTTQAPNTTFNDLGGLLGYLYAQQASQPKPGTV
jgi:hypothetical protein